MKTKKAGKEGSEYSNHSAHSRGVLCRTASNLPCEAHRKYRHEPCFRANLLGGRPAKAFSQRLHGIQTAGHQATKDSRACWPHVHSISRMTLLLSYALLQICTLCSAQSFPVAGNLEEKLDTFVPE